MERTPSPDHNTITASVVIRRPVDQVFNFYRDFENLPSFLGDAFADIRSELKRDAGETVKGSRYRDPFTELLSEATSRSRVNLKNTTSPTSGS
jgi:uncharacterized protein YndB with AHSA1/START domain